METESICFTDSLFGIRTMLKLYLKAPPDTLPILDSIWPGEGERWQFYGQLVPITNSGNPGATDFKAILNRKNCWYRFFPDPDYVPRRLAQSHHRTASRIRNAVSDHWHGNGKEISLLKAVCLGDRSDLDKELKLAYSNAGAMHLLAVSGLHMGLIWWVLNHLLSWMVRLSGKEIFRSISIIAILWIFAFVTGFSSSVSRSATMLTLFTAGRLMCQRMQALNSILVSAFFLIAMNPSRMLDVGFQLSYAAILGIVTLYPVFRRLFTIKNRWIRRIWEAAIVSFTAQISTAPLVIYYFHQVPVYSLISSMITIPLLSLLIALFVVSIPFMAAGIGSQLFNGLLIKLAFLINFSVEQVASIPGGVVNELNLSRVSLCLWMGMICVSMIVLNRRTVLARYLLIGLVSAMLCWTAWHRYFQTHSSEMVIAHFNQASILTFREGDRVDHFCLYGDSTAFSYLEQYTSQNWSGRNFRTRMIELGNQDIVRGSASGGFRMGPGIWLLGNNQTKGWVISQTSDRKAYVIDTCVSERFEEIQGDFILLTGNPLLRHIPYEILNGVQTVILDGSCKNWYLSEIERYIEDWEGSFVLYKTGEHGAYMKRW
jgi:ComEC/Rec2-related protein